MNDRADFDSNLSSAFAAYADRAPVNVDAVALATAVTRDTAPGRWSFPVPRAWLLVGTILALLLLSAALVVGSYVQRPRTTLGGGGLMVVGQLDVTANGHFSTATAVHVFTLDAATGARVAIVDWMLPTDTQSGPVTWAKWSPDRTHALLFDADRTPLGVLDIGSHRLTGLRELTRSIQAYGSSLGSFDEEVAWSPASDRFAILIPGELADGARRVLIFDLSGHEVARLALPDGASARFPSWSPDGSSILVVGCPCGAGTRHLYIVPVDGSATRSLLGVTDQLRPALWSPEGSRIAYSTPTGIAIVAVADGRQMNLTEGHDLRPAWSPDGHRIAFQRENAAGESQGIYLVDADGSNLTRLTDAPDERPEWSPDGTELVFSRDDRNTSCCYPDAWVVSTAGGEPRLLLKHANVDW